MSDINLDVGLQLGDLQKQFKQIEDRLAKLAIDIKANIEVPDLTKLQNELDSLIAKIGIDTSELDSVNLPTLETDVEVDTSGINEVENEINAIPNEVDLDIEVNNTQLDETVDKIDKINEASEKGTSSFSNFGKGIAIAGAAATAALGGAFLLAQRFGNVADRLLDVESITGTSTDSLQEWQFVAKQAGVDSEFFAKSAEQVGNQLKDLDRDSSQGAKALQALGIATKDAEGNLKSTGDITEEAIQALSGYTDEAERNRIAQQLFAGAAKDIIPIIDQGTDAIERQKNEARELGLVQSQESLQNANAFRQTLETLQSQVEAIGFELVGALTPLINSLLPVLQRLASLIGDTLGPIIESLAPILENTFNLIVDILNDVFDTIGPVIETLLTTVFDVINQLLPVIQSVVTSLKPIFELIIGQLLPVIQLVVTSLKPLMPVINVILDIFVQLLRVAIIPLIVQIKIFSAKFEAVVDVISSLLPILDPILDLFITLIDEVFKLLPSLIAPIVSIYKALGGVIRVLFKAIQPLLKTFIELVKQILPPLIDIIVMLAEIFESIVPILSQALVPIIKLLAEVLSGVLGAALKALTPLIVGLIEGLKLILAPITALFKLLGKDTGLEDAEKAFGNLGETIEETTEDIEDNSIALDDNKNKINDNTKAVGDNDEARKRWEEGFKRSQSIIQGFTTLLGELNTAFNFDELFSFDSNTAITGLQDIQQTIEEIDIDEIAIGFRIDGLEQTTSELAAFRNEFDIELQDLEQKKLELETEFKLTGNRELLRDIEQVEKDIQNTIIDNAKITDEERVKLRNITEQRVKEVNELATKNAQIELEKQIKAVEDAEAKKQQTIFQQAQSLRDKLLNIRKLQTDDEVELINIETESRLNALEDGYNKEIEAAKDNKELLLAIEKEYALQRQKIQEESDAKIAEANKTNTDRLVEDLENAALKTAETLLDFSDVYKNNLAIDDEINKVKEQYAEDTAALREQLQNREISQQEFNEAMIDLDKAKLEEEKKLNDQRVSIAEDVGKKLAKATFDAVEAQIPSLVALITAKMIAANPLLGAVAAAGLTGLLTGLLSIARSAAGFADGVIGLKPGDKGNRKASDTIPAWLTPGESVMTAKETNKYGKYLQAMRDGKFETLLNKDLNPVNVSLLQDNRSLEDEIRKTNRKLDILTQVVGYTKADVYHHNEKSNINVEVKLPRSNYGLV